MSANVVHASKEEANKSGGEPTREVPQYAPRTDIIESPESIILIAEMPGVAEGGVDITLEKNVLTIVGQIAQTNPALEATKDLALEISEYEIGDYRRTFALSDEIDRDGIHATIKDGVLTLNLPKSQVARSRKIAVKAGR